MRWDQEEFDDRWLFFWFLRANDSYKNMNFIFNSRNSSQHDEEESKAWFISKGISWAPKKNWTFRDFFCSLFARTSEGFKECKFNVFTCSISLRFFCWFSFMLDVCRPFCVFWYWKKNEGILIDNRLLLLDTLDALFNFFLSRLMTSSPQHFSKKSSQCCIFLKLFTSCLFTKPSGKTNKSSFPKTQRDIRQHNVMNVYRVRYENEEIFSVS